MAEAAAAPALCDDAASLLQTTLGRLERDLRALLTLCESPLEELILVAMWNHWRPQILPERGRMQALLVTDAGARWLVIEPQRLLVSAGQHFRADFLVSLRDPVAPEIRLSPIVVEVDGRQHDQPEAVTRDRRRDRAMAGLGFRVARFSGSEVYHRASACVEELDGLLRGAP